MLFHIISPKTHDHTTMLKKLFKTIKVIILIIFCFVLLTTLYINLHPTFGGTPNNESLTRIKQSPNFSDSHFKNLVSTEASSIKITNPSENKNSLAFIKNFISPPTGKNPSSPITTQPLNISSLKNEDFIWLGHSTVLFRTNNTTIITDPVFHNAAPISFGIEPFKMTHTPKIKDLPFIDIVLISHDHYDHLDRKAIKKMLPKVGHFHVPLGVKAHLLLWGVPEKKVSEYDWYEETTINNTKLVFTPSRHFSGRGITNHRKTLWGSWAVISPELKVYFSGDGGYSPEFAKIGKRFGGFDIAFMEDGAYNERWQDVHMLPEQSAQASIDLQTKVVLPIHWCKFDLSTHTWKDPVERISVALNTYNTKVTDDKKIRLATPKIGQTFSLKKIPQTAWWQKN